MQSTILLTGATSGIGLAMGQQLAARGHHILVAGRKADEREKVAAELNQSQGSGTALALDLASLASVRAAVDVVKQGPKLGGILANAGLYPTEGKLTEDGFEMQWGTHHVGHAALILGLVDHLQPSTPVVLTSSKLHQLGKQRPATYRSLDGYTAMKAYSQSKMANILFATALAQEFPASQLRAYAAHPGYIRTNIQRDVPTIVRVIIESVASSTATGARTMLKSFDSNAPSGSYFERGKVTKPKKAACDPAAATALYEQTLAWIRA